MYNLQIVCFCDIPLSDVSIHINKYSKFGLSFDKDFIAQAGGVPVFYIAKYARVRIKTRDDISNEEKLRMLDNEGVDSISYHRYKGDHFDIMINEYHKLFSEIGNLLNDHEELGNRLKDFKDFLGFHIFSYLKFFDHNYADDHKENYYFEREWRMTGNLKFHKKDVKTILIPREYAARFRKDFLDYTGQLIFVD